MTAKVRTPPGVSPIRFGIIPFTLAALLPAARPAQAIPAFAAQTGMPCIQCHIGAYGPQLTPFGRAFKISGYTLTGGEGWVSHVPIAIMIQPTFTNTGTGFPQDQIPHHYAQNNNFSIDQISLFIGGNIGEHSGAFAQAVTWDGVANSFAMDNIDVVPYTTTVDLAGHDLRIGTTLNNSPTVQDPYNTTPSWSFAYIESGLAPQPTAETMLSGGFAEAAIGYTAYAWYDSSLYLEAGAYSSLSSWALGRLGTGYGIGSTTSPAPYFRAAYQWDWGESSAHIGTIMMHADVNPVLYAPFATTSAFGGDHYTDYAFDAGYQFLGSGKHIATFQSIFTHETQDLSGSAGVQGLGNPAKYNLNTFRADVSYWYENTYGLSLAWHKSWGPSNPVLYVNDGTIHGSANNKPNSNAFVIEADWVPFGKEDSFWRPLVNMKLGIQYIVYTQFNGGTKNYDGAGRNAADNNTLMLFAWMIF